MNVFKGVTDDPASFPGLSLAAKMVGAQGRKGRGKEERQRFASLLSLSRDSSRANTQFLVFRARLLATEIEASEQEATDDPFSKLRGSWQLSGSITTECFFIS